ncbi:hypothetical protein S83_057633 [Arachis hypogaea]
MVERSCDIFLYLLSPIPHCLIHSQYLSSLFASFVFSLRVVAWVSASQHPRQRCGALLPEFQWSLRLRFFVY